MFLYLAFPLRGFPFQPVLRCFDFFVFLFAICFFCCAFTNALLLAYAFRLAVVVILGFILENEWLWRPPCSSPLCMEQMVDAISLQLSFDCWSTKLLLKFFDRIWTNSSIRASSWALVRFSSSLWADAHFVVVVVVVANSEISNPDWNEDSKPSPRLMYFVSLSFVVEAAAIWRLLCDIF